MRDIVLEKIVSADDNDISQLIKMLDGSFATAMEDCPEEERNMPVPNGQDIMDGIAQGLDVLKIFVNGILVGGSVLAINLETQKNTVELLFISASAKGRGLGTEVWKAIEHAYPDTRIWCLGTPYFLKRNVHFYVNKCGFAITNYYNKWNPMIVDGIADDGDFFWFEKNMKNE